MRDPPWLHRKGDAFELLIKVLPRASPNAFAGVTGNTLKIRIQAPPVAGRATASLIRFLADNFGVPQRQVEICTGQSKRCKRVRIKRPRTISTLLKALGRLDQRAGEVYLKE